MWRNERRGSGGKLNEGHPCDMSDDATTITSTVATTTSIVLRLLQLPKSLTMSVSVFCMDIYNIDVCIYIYIYIYINIYIYIYIYIIHIYSIKPLTLRFELLLAMPSYSAIKSW